MEELIRKYVDLSTNSNAKGWFTTKCAACSDYKVRAGFLFEPMSVGYHCFNCGVKTRYNINEYVSEKMQEVLTSFGISQEEINKLNFNALGKTKQTIVKKEEINKLIELPLPEIFEPLDNSVWGTIAKEYLEFDRGVTDFSKFFICNRNKTKEEQKWYGRLIIPFYREGKLVFYQGRTLTNNNKRYENAFIGDTTVLYNYDEIFKNTKDILFVTEGVFDAYHLKGVAIMGNALSDKKISIIKQTRRKVVYIPDKTGGIAAAKKALSVGWSVSLPDIGNCKDVNEAVMKYGYLYTYKSILDNIKSGVEGKLLINLKLT